MQRELSSISFKDFERGERFDKVIVQISTVRTLLHITVLREILHPHADIYHWLPTVLTVQSGLREETERKREKWRMGREGCRVRQREGER